MPRRHLADARLYLLVTGSLCSAALDWTIAEAATPDQTVDLAHRDPPRAVLLDVNFDESDGPTGFDVCKLLKNDPATQSIPVARSLPDY